MTIIITVLTVLSIWLFGLGQHRTIFENSILSTSILSIAFFLFLTIGLYKGVKLKDNIDKLTDKLKPSKIPNLADAAANGDFIRVGDEIEGIVVSIVLWIVVTILVALFLGCLVRLFGQVLYFLSQCFIGFSFVHYDLFSKIQTNVKATWRQVSLMDLVTRHFTTFGFMELFWRHII